MALFRCRFAVFSALLVFIVLLRNYDYPAIIIQNNLLLNSHSFAVIRPENRTSCDGKDLLHWYDEIYLNKIGLQGRKLRSHWNLIDGNSMTLRISEDSILNHFAPIINYTASLRRSSKSAIILDLSSLEYRFAINDHTFRQYLILCTKIRTKTNNLCMSSVPYTFVVP